MKRLIIVALTFLLAVPAMLASDENNGWSKPVNGIRARLSVLPSEKPGSPFCRVFIELQNVAEVVGQIRIRFDTDRLDLHVADSKGKQLPLPNNKVYDGLSPGWETIALPHSGTMKFRIDINGHGYSPADKVIVDVGSQKAWFVPQNGSTYYLCGSLSIQRQKSDHPYMDWSGTLDLPGTEVPNAK
jgi:hypothetical protein